MTHVHCNCIHVHMLCTYMYMYIFVRGLTKLILCHVRVMPSCTQLVKYVVISLIGCLGYNPRPLKEVCAHLRSGNPVFPVKPDLDVLAKSTAVVISNSLSIPNCLQEKQATSHACTCTCTCTCTLYICTCRYMAYMYMHAEGRGFKSHPRQQFFFERLLPWDLICISFLSFSVFIMYCTCTLPP